MLWARGEDSRVKQNAESMLREAIEAGDAQTRRVLQLQRGISQTRRTLAACLLRASLSAAGRSKCAVAMHKWGLMVGHVARVRAATDARSARAEGQKARETARTAEQFARESSESSVKEVAEAKKRLAAAERARSTLRAELNTVREELVAERSQHIPRATSTSRSSHSSSARRRTTPTSLVSRVGQGWQSETRCVCCGSHTRC